MNEMSDEMEELLLAITLAATAFREERFQDLSLSLKEIFLLCRGMKKADVQLMCDVDFLRARCIAPMKAL
jgi:hypothetical protein